MSKIDPLDVFNPPAFPQSTDRLAPQGMSLRDWFAGMALQGFLSAPASNKGDLRIAVRSQGQTQQATTAIREGVKNETTYYRNG